MLKINSFHFISFYHLKNMIYDDEDDDDDDDEIMHHKGNLLAIIY